VAGRTERAHQISSAGAAARLAVLAVLGATAALLLFMALTRMAALLQYPSPHDGLEGTLLYEARLLRSGQPLYQPLELHRFLSAPYPPVHYGLLALFDLIPGPHVFFGGRLLSLLAALGVAALASLIVRRCGAPWPLALLAAGLVLSAPPLQLWGTRIKPDVLALLFTTLGLALGQRALLEPARGRVLVWAAISFAAAFYTKQTAVAAPLAAGLALLAADTHVWWATGRTQPAAGRPDFIAGLPLRWRTLVFGLTYLAIVLAAWLALDLASAGQYSVHVWWGGQRVEWWSFSLFRKIVGLLAFWWPQMLLAAMALPLSIRRRALFVPVCYALVAPLTLLGAGETGSHHNHLLETHLALAIAGCAALAALARALLDPGPQQPSIGGWRVAPVLLAGLLLALQVAYTFNPPAWYDGELQPLDSPERYLNFMRNTPGEILADDTGLLFQAGRDLRYDDPSTMGPAAAIGKWDPSGLIGEIEARHFSAIMLPVNLEKSQIDPAGRWTPAMLAAIHANYKLQFRDTIYTYVPRP
jgi:hypothetical protein